MAAVLFLPPHDLGEAVLATGALGHLLEEGDRLMIAGGDDTLSLFRAAPGLIARRRLAADAGAAAVCALWLELAGTRFDVVLDGRGGIFARLVRRRRRLALRPAARVRHRVEDWSDALNAEAPLRPMLWLDAEARAAAAALAPDAAPLLLLAPGGNARAKRWPPERFAAVGRRLASGPLAGARIAVLGAASRDTEITRSVAASLDADGLTASDLGEAPDLLAAAALMERATLCIGNDNALTHIAAAAGAPTLTLFGPTDERVRAPCGPRARTLRGRPLAEFASLSPLDARAAMEDVSIDAVEAAALEILHAGGLR